MKLLKIALLSLISLSAFAQTEVAKNTTFRAASSTSRWALDGNATGVGQVNNTGVFSRFALFSEVQALSNGAVTSVNSKTITSGTSDVSLTTDNIPQGVLKYYSDALARAAFTATGPLNYNSATGAFTFSGTPAVVGLGNVTNNLQVINAGGVVSFGGGTLAARPAAGTANRYYVATDQGGVYLDNGTTWILQEPAISGDVVIAQGATTSVLATVNANVGTFGSGTAAPVFTTDAKGRITGVTTATITPTGIGAVPVSLVASYPGLAGVTAPATGFIKFIQVGTDGVYSDTDDIYLIKPSGKYHKIPLLPSEN